MDGDKHTPGPWQWHKAEYGDHHDLVHFVGSEQWPKVIHSDGSACGEYSPDIDVNGADARLIAAAPDLLAVVNDMLSGLAYLRDTKAIPYGFGIDRLEETGRAAIARATAP